MAFQCVKKTKVDDRDDDYKRLASSSSSGPGPLILRYHCGSGYLRSFCSDHLRIPRSDHLRISIIDGESEKKCKVRGLKSLPRAFFIGCCNGLALFTSETPSFKHIVVNPLSNEITTKIYGPYKGGELCGLFVHPLAKEYRILSMQKIGNGKYEYQLYLFGSKKWRKIAKPYFKHKPTRYWSCSVNGQKRVNANPAIVNDALHWEKDTSIMVFDMISKEVPIRKAPAIEGPAKYVDNGLSLNEDRLCFCFLGTEEPVMDIWVLEDYAKWSWTKKYVVDLDFDMNMYPMESGLRFTTLNEVIRYVIFVGIRNNELVLYWRHGDVFLSFRL